MSQFYLGGGHPIHTLANFNVQIKNPGFIELIFLLVAICGIFIPHVLKNVVYLYHNVVHLYHVVYLYHNFAHDPFTIIRQ